MDPLERQQKIESYGHGHETLLEGIKDIPRDMWHYRGERDPWTIYEVLIHITDSEANSYVRCRKCIAQPGTDVLGYDENGWTKALDYEDQNVDDAIELFRWLRGNTYKLIKMLPDDIWTRTMNHSENGIITLEDWLLTYEDHIPAHVRQIQAIYDEWKSMQPA